MKTPSFLFVVLFCFIGISQVADASQPHKTHLLIVAPGIFSPVEIPKGSKNIDFVCRTSDGKEILASQNDAAMIKNVLMNQQTVVYELASRTINPPTHANFQKEKNRFLKAVRPRDRVIVYFSSHAFLDKNENAWLLLEDSRITVDSDGQRLKTHSNAVSFAEIAELIQKVDAEEVICLMDCCYSGSLGDALQYHLKSLQNDEKKSIYLICGSSRRQYSHIYAEKGLSLFTSYLCSGIAGMADRDHNGKTDLDELFHHVRSCVNLHSNLIAKNGLKSLPSETGVFSQTPVRFLAGSSQIPELALPALSFDEAFQFLGSAMDDILVTNKLTGKRVVIGEFQAIKNGQELLANESLGQLICAALETQLEKRLRINTDPILKDVLCQTRNIRQKQLYTGDCDLSVTGRYTRLINPDRIQLDCELRHFNDAAPISSFTTNIILSSEIEPILDVPTNIPSVTICQNMQDRESCVSVSFTKREKGQTTFLPLSPDDNRVMPVRIGDTLRIHVSNNSSRHLAAMVLIDGLSILSHEQDPSGSRLQTPYEHIRKGRYFIISPHTKYVFSGWYTSPASGQGNLFSARELEVVSAPDALGYRENFSTSLGDVRVLIYEVEPIPNNSRSGIGIGHGKAFQEKFRAVPLRIASKEPLEIFQFTYVESKK